MSDDLQALIDKIRSEGVSKARDEAEQILASARTKAAKIVQDAEQTAAQALAKAEEDAKLSAERGARTLEQAARDVILNVGQGVEALLSRLVREKTAAAMDASTLKELLKKAADAYMAGSQAAGSAIQLAETDAQALGDFFESELKAALAAGTRIQTDRAGIRGFKVSLENGKVVHDFTTSAIAESLAELVRPRLAEILRSAAKAPSA